VTAQSFASGMLAVTAVVHGSIAISIDSPADAYLGPANAVTVPVRIAAGGTPSRGFTARREAAARAYAAPVGLTVQQANVSSIGYAVIEQLSRAAHPGTEWSINGKRLAESTSTLLTLNAVYGSREMFLCQVSVSDRAVSDTVENSFVLTVIIN
jgi:hypothetical protein